MMSQDELQERVVNIESHVFKITTRQLVLYAWGITAGACLLCGSYYGINRQFADLKNDVNVNMMRMEIRINAKIDTVATRQRDNKADLMEKINNSQQQQQVEKPVNRAGFYTGRIVNGRLVLTKVNR